MPRWYRRKKELQRYFNLVDLPNWKGLPIERLSLLGLSFDDFFERTGAILAFDFGATTLVRAVTVSRAAGFLAFAGAVVPDNNLSAASQSLALYFEAIFARSLRSSNCRVFKVRSSQGIHRQLVPAHVS